MRLLCAACSLALPLLLAGGGEAYAQHVQLPLAQQGDGTSIEFHGWSPDSEFVAYTRVKHYRSESGKDGPPQLVRRSLHRRVKRGRFRGTGPIGDEHIPRLAERKGYRVELFERLRIDDTETWFIAPEGTYKLRLSVGKSLIWELSFEDEVVVRRAFDTPYVEHDVHLYPSPDRRSLIVLMHLSTGWTVHGAVYPLALPTRVREAYRSLTESERSP